MNDVASTLITLGVLLVAGLAADTLGRRTPLPRVSILLVLGILVGPEAFDVLPADRSRWMPLVSNMTLVMVGFLLGHKLGRDSLGGLGRVVLCISVSVVALSALTVFLGLVLLGAPVGLALVLGAIAAATAPAATADVVHEERASGPFSRVLLGVVAIDDVWGLVLFSVALASLESAAGGSGSDALVNGLREIGGAALLGGALGVLLAALDKHVRPGETTLVEAMAGIFLCGGLALWMETSFLLASVTMGCVLVRIAGERERVFKAVESVEWPFLVVFFMLAGASLELSALPAVGFVGIAYVVLRILGRLVGGWCGGALARADSATRRGIGWALLPQAGVAMGMALVASQQLPELGEALLPIVIASTVLFELVGPVATRRALRHAGEASTD